TAAGARNLISGNTTAGISISSDNNLVAGNFIGTDVNGDPPIPNPIGILIASSGNTVGGTTVAARNIISGNTTAGVSISGSNNVVEGNFIGTDDTGTIAGANNIGILISMGSGNEIGGTVAGARNLISGNTAAGISIASDGNNVQGDFIGTDVTGTAAIANAIGIVITSTNNLIGGT